MRLSPHEGVVVQHEWWPPPKDADDLMRRIAPEAFEDENRSGR